MKIRPIAHIWIILASMCLLVSGFLSVIVTGAKASGIKELITNIDIIRWCLVIHVNLSSLVWFTALPVGVILLTSERVATSLREKVGLALSVMGILLMFSVPPQEGLGVVLSNYVPILAHSRYYWALILYVAGVAVSVCTLEPILLSDNKSRIQNGLSEIGFGLAIGVMIFIVGLVTTFISFRELRGVEMISNLQFFEIGMWGGGHLLQHASAAFMVCCWSLLLTAECGRPLLSRDKLFGAFAWLSLPIFMAPFLLKYSVQAGEFRSGFSLLMQWGIFPAVLAFLYFVGKNLPVNFFKKSQYRVVALGWSTFLIILGFIFGALIQGPDMRVPGHYHASIGAVSLTFMATAFFFLSQNSADVKWMLRSAWTYGCGQSLFATGMFVAGTFGMSRKTYGSEHSFDHWGQTLGFSIMAGGGLIALLGGIFFAVAIYPYLKLGRRISHNN